MMTAIRSTESNIHQNIDFAEFLKKKPEIPPSINPTDSQAKSSKGLTPDEWKELADSIDINPNALPGSAPPPLLNSSPPNTEDSVGASSDVRPSPSGEPPDLDPVSALKANTALQIGPVPPKKTSDQTEETTAKDKKKTESATYKLEQSTAFNRTRPDGALSNKEAKKLAVDVMKALMKDFNLTAKQAAGVVGNFFQESRMNPHINGGGKVGKPTYDNGQSYGWAQWLGARKQALIDHAQKNGMHSGSPAANYEYLKKELGKKGTEHESLKALKQTDTIAEATTSFRANFERAGNPNDTARISAARFYYNAYKASQNA